MKILVTGAAGFIGANLVLQLLRREAAVEILGIDSLNDYYDPAIKDYRPSTPLRDGLHRFARWYKEFYKK